MFKKIFTYFLKFYETHSLLMQKKVKILLISNIIIIIGCAAILPYAIFMSLWIALVLFLTILWQVGSLYLIKFGKFSAAVYGLMIFTFFGNTSSLFSNGFGVEISKNIFELYVYGCVMFFLLFEVCLIANKRLQVILTVIEGIVGVLFVYFVRILPNYSMHPLETYIQLHLNTGLTVIFVYGISGFFATLIISITQSTITFAEDLAVKNKKRSDKLEKIISTTKNNMEIGERLISSSQNSHQYIERNSQSLVQMQSEMTTFNSYIDMTSEVNTSVVDSSIKVNALIEAQNSMITETSSTIEEITANINNISAKSKDKKNIIDQLLLITKTTEDDMMESMESINETSKLSNEMMEIINVIVNIATQTDLLALNAAIEAAHAGEYGRGFAVVADEIGKLADDTEKNTKIIASLLKNNLKSIQNAVEINKRVSKKFRDVINKVNEVSQGMEETIAGMEEMVLGTTGIMQAVTEMVESVDVVNASITTMKNHVDKNKSSIDNVKISFQSFHDKINNMNESLKELIDEITKIDSIGKENIQTIRNLEQEIINVQSETSNTDTSRSGV